MVSLVNIAAFISAHGFGHAARAAAVMNAIAEKYSAVHFDIYTVAPAWFFQESLLAEHRLHPILTDIGIVQETPMQEDLPATLRALDAFLPFEPALVSRLAQDLRTKGCQVALCDISPLGIAVANAAGLPSILVENFTWDWIYQGYAQEAPRLEPFIAYLCQAFAAATYHIQAVPLCAPSPRAALTTSPIARNPVTPANIIRSRLGVPSTARLILVTMGGIPERFYNLERVSGSDDIYLVIPGGSNRVELRNHMILLPHHSSFYHPDLIYACNAVVGKAGYSTLSEAYHAGVPFAYFARPSFRESGPLSAFIDREMSGFEIPLSDYHSGAWIDHLPDLLELPRYQRKGINGADQVAEFCLNILGISPYSPT
ncbi:MAG TPA: hypothetical protein VLH85_08775 [Levilinea sp.]|nr:hypothetical protein [Levilinea sp.]